MPTALVVDDDNAFEAFCLNQVEGVEGLDLVFARSDVEALSMLTHRRDLDVAVVTIDNPNLSGLELFRQLHQGRKMRIPRIALCDCNDLRLIRQAMAEGAVDFVAKPVVFSELAATILRVVEETERRRHAWRVEAQLSAIRRELEIAGEIQRHILRLEFPQRQDLVISARTWPAKEMGGDFYDCFTLEDGRLGLVVADVTGKGVPAAFFMAVAHTLIRATAVDGGTPGECLSQVNALLCRHNLPGMLVSVFYGMYDPADGLMTFANAGHPPPLLRDAEGGVRPIGGGEGVIVGVDADTPYPDGQLQLLPGETLLMYTDGVTEAFDRKHRQFGEERLLCWLAEQHETEPDALVDGLWDEVGQFTAGAEQSDDFTVMVIGRLDASR